MTPSIALGARALRAALLLSFAAGPGHGVADAIAPPTLTLEAAVELALSGQPLLAGIAAQADAARDDAVAAGQLPDPELFVGLRDVPIEDDDAFSLSADSDTQIVVGVRQAVPRREKRQLAAELRTREADAFDVDHELIARRVRRETGRAWLALWRDERAITLVDAQLEQADLETQALAVGLRAGSQSQAEVLAADLAAERLRDAAMLTRQSADASRAALGRWIAAAALRSTAEHVPDTPLPPLADLTTALPLHPEIVALEARVGVGRTEVALAAVQRRSDWLIEVGYGHRRDFADMAMVQIGLGLPLFPRNRQDRRTASAAARVVATEAARDDALRRLIAELEDLHSQASRLDARIARYDSAILPRASAMVEARLAEWRSTRGSLADLLAARRTLLELRLERLDLARDAAARRVDVEYFAATSVIAAGGAR
jgi:cobalt-zinc-cadmium efflux system outer membrane protein